MDTWEILCTLRNVNSFFDVFPSDLLSSSRPVQTPCTLIVNADPQIEGGSHWLAIRLTLRSSSAYYFDSYGIVPLVPGIQDFLKHNCTTSEYNKRQLQGLTSDVCGQYCRFAPSSWTGVTLLSNSSRSLPAVAMQTDRWRRCSRPKFGSTCRVVAGVNSTAAAYEMWVLTKIP